MSDRPPRRDPPFSAATFDLGVVRPTPLGDDVAAIAERLAGLDPWARVGRPAASFVDYLTRPMAATFRFALRIETAPVGVLSVRHPFLRGPYVEIVALFPEAQRRGIGRALFDWIAREVEGEATNLWLCVTEWNAPARAFYAALGFVEVGPLPDVAVAGQTELFLRKVLAAPHL